MSASPRTAQPTLGINQLRVALVAVAMAIALVAFVAFGQLTATKSQAAPAGAAPAQFDHGTSSGELYNAGAAAAAPQWDHGTSSSGLTSSGASKGSIRSYGTHPR